MSRRSSNSQTDWVDVALKTAATVGGAAVLLYAGFEYLMRESSPPALEAPVQQSPGLKKEEPSHPKDFGVSGEICVNEGEEVNAFLCPITGDIMRGKQLFFQFGYLNYC